MSPVLQQFGLRLNLGGRGLLLVVTGLAQVDTYQSNLNTLHRPVRTLLPTLPSQALANALVWQLARDVKNCGEQSFSGELSGLKLQLHVPNDE